MTEMLKEALFKCNEVAEKSYDYALRNLTEIESKIIQSEKEIDRLLINFSKTNVKDEKILTSVKSQLNAIKTSFTEVRKDADSRLKERKNELDKFTITLFGRTMAGKSTLMAILTKGNGDKIGKGAQRTTTDVRSYEWNNLKIVDVPGIAAFEGQEDEKIAFEAAEKADLVLFLITDDAPQDEEAKCLAKILRLGKPVICLCNIKKYGNIDINNPVTIKRFLNNPICKIDKNRISEIEKQFITLLERYIPSHKKIKFISSSLRARYLADQHEYSEFKTSLIDNSNFNNVEQEIINTVINNGLLMRKRNFIDFISNSLISLFDVFLRNAKENSANGKLLLVQKRKLDSWKNSYRTEICGTLSSVNFKRKFYGNSIRNKLFPDKLEKVEKSLKNDNCRINTFVNSIISQLYDELDKYVDNNFENSEAGNEWNRIVASYDIEKQVKLFCNQIAEECNTKIQELAKELEEDIKIREKYNQDFKAKMETIFDKKRFFRWLNAGVVVIAEIVGAFYGGWLYFTIKGITGIALSFFEWLFESKEERERKAKAKLRQKVIDNIEELRLKLKIDLTNWFFSTIYSERLSSLSNDLHSLISVLFGTGDKQKKLAVLFNEQHESVTKDYLFDSLGNIGLDNLKENIKNVARIPEYGYFIVFDENYEINNQEIRKLSGCLQEKIYYCSNSNEQEILAKNILGKMYFRIEKDIKIIHIPSLKKGESYILRKAKFAQQILNLLATE